LKREKKLDTGVAAVSALYMLVVTGLAAVTDVWLDTGFATVSVLFILLITGFAAVTDVWFDLGLAAVSCFTPLVTRLAVVTVQFVSTVNVDSKMARNGTRLPEPSAEFGFCFLFEIGIAFLSEKLIVCEELLVIFELLAVTKLSQNVFLNRYLDLSGDLPTSKSSGVERRVIRDERGDGKTGWVEK
jgi:hypothetical protein